MSRRYYDDDDDYEPIYRGDRNYEGVSSSIGDALSDLTVSVKKAGEKIMDEHARREVIDKVKDHANAANRKVDELVEKAKEVIDAAASAADPPPRRSTSGMPDGCFCDMRGFACPKHRGREKWRQSQDYAIHVQHNLGGQAADGGADDAK